MIKIISPRRRVRSRARIGFPIVTGKMVYESVFRCTGLCGTMIEVVVACVGGGRRIFAPLQNINLKRGPELASRGCKSSKS